MPNRELDPETAAQIEAALQQGFEDPDAVFNNSVITALINDFQKKQEADSKAAAAEVDERKNNPSHAEVPTDFVVPPELFASLNELIASNQRYQSEAEAEVIKRKAKTAGEQD